MREKSQCIPEGDFVFKVAEICEELDYTELFNSYVRKWRKVNPITLFEILVFGYMEHLYSGRDIEKACKTDIRFTGNSGEYGVVDLTCNAPSPPKNKTIPCGWSCFLHRKDLNASARERERCERRRWRMKQAKASDKTRSIATPGARRLCFGGAMPCGAWRENLSISAIQVHNSNVADLFFFAFSF